MSAQHTPGPWRYWACKVDSCASPPMYDYVQFANPRGHVFRAPLGHLREEDARLIAAAPDLLHALRQIDSNAAESVEWVRRVAREAIAKATGGNP